MASTFGKAFAREFGKNTAKLVSNAVYRDHWSTPYRRVDPSLKEYRETKVRLAEEKIALQRQANEEKLAIQRAAVESRAAIERTNQLYTLDTAVLDNIDKLNDLPIPNNIQGVKDLLNKLSVQMRSVNLEKDDAEGKIRNKYLFALIEKYDQALFELQCLNPSDPHIPKYADLLLSRREEILLRKNTLTFKDSFKLFRFPIIIIALFLSIYLPGLLDGSLGDSAGFLFLLFLVLVTLIVIAILRVVIKKRRINKVLEAERAKYKIIEPGTLKEEAAGTSPIVPKTVVEEPPKESIQEAKNIFFDLNEENRIGRKLAVLWDKYAGKVPSKFLDRKPIFAADGVEDSILFVGVNPDYSADDDNKFLKNEDGKSLLYGSFYGRDDAPGYFKALELFASHFGKTYTQINLLYVRENNRDELMKVDGNFIREQLELSYDTLVKIQPKAVIFFTTYCKNMVFGKGRWVDPDSFSDGHYILNGTSIPVFFSEDVTVLDEEQLGNLADDLNKALS